MSGNNNIVVIPVHKESFDDIEQFSVDYSLHVLGGRHEVIFIGPQGIDLNYYKSNYHYVRLLELPGHYFASVESYSRLLLTKAFYEIFIDYEFILILQPDAILLKDELDVWSHLSCDYIGAPWPGGQEILINIGEFGGEMSRHVRAFVGNGGLSLRRVQKCISLLDEFPEAASYFYQSGSNEDLFFSFMGSLSTDFIIPDEVLASRFAMEMSPSHYFSINGNVCPMGAHAWARCEPEFWRARLGVG
jgi:hypothetical protein